MPVSPWNSPAANTASRSKTTGSAFTPSASGWTAQNSIRTCATTSASTSCASARSTSTAGSRFPICRRAARSSDLCSRRNAEQRHESCARHAGRRPHPVPQGSGRAAARAQRHRGGRGHRGCHRGCAPGAGDQARRAAARSQTAAARGVWPAVQKYGWSVPALILTVSDSEDDLANALHAGARGYLLKDMEPEDVIDAILRAVRGETVVAPAMTMKLVDLLQPGRQNKTKENLLRQLTEREQIGK